MKTFSIRNGEKNTKLTPENLTKNYRQAHPEEIRKNAKRWYRKNRVEQKRTQKNREAALRDKIYARYGNQCVCCGETEKFFLTLDHVKGLGKKHRKEIRRSGFNFYRWIVKHRYPKILQLMCYNCNCGRYRNGGKCPHRTSKIDN